MRAANTIKVALIASAALAAPDLAFAGQDLTAKYVMAHMKPDERFSYIAGVVEGLAYARYARDNTNLAADKKTTKGMECVYDWFYKDNRKTMDLIYAAFESYGQFTPGAVISALQKKACGE